MLIAFPSPGAILTKLDGDSRGGAALSVKEVANKPIKFVGTGEKLDALEPFYPDRMAQRILGEQPADGRVASVAVTHNAWFPLGLKWNGSFDLVFCDGCVAQDTDTTGGRTASVAFHV